MSAAVLRALATARRAEAEALEAAAEALEASSNSTRHYDRHRLPPGAASWRAARETASREGIAMASVGRCVVIDASSWDAWLSSKTSRARPTLTRSDATALSAVGVTLMKAVR